MTRYLKTIYFLAILPLLTGSLIFFYWLYKRIWYAENIEIELLAMFSMIEFALFGLISFVLCICFVTKNKKEWKKIISPMVIITLTFPLIYLYAALYDSFSEKAFVRIINDTDKQITRVWSDNFELIYYTEKGNDFIISFYPVYTYDWSIDRSSSFNYKINPVHIDLRKNENFIVSYNLPAFSKGECKTIRVNDIMTGKY